MLNHTFFSAMLSEADPNALAQHSVLNHHANGMDYLCLHRTPELTVKVYLIEKPENANDGFLVNPHTHRYDFGTVVLAGALEHVRVDVAEPRETGLKYDRYIYEPGAAPQLRDCVSLRWRPERHSVKDTYWVNTREIHTLRMLGADPAPVVLGLIQLSDTRQTSRLYLRPTSTFRRPDSRVPTVREYQERAARVRSLMREFC